MVGVRASRGTWTRHASCVLARSEVSSVEWDSLRARAALLGVVWPPVGAVGVDVDGFYGVMGELGFDYGPVFSGVRALWRRGEDLFAEVELPEAERGEAAGYGFHPGLFDCAIQPMAPRLSGLGEGVGSGEARLPFAFEGVRLFASGAAVLRVHLSFVGEKASMVATDEGGGLVASLRSLVLRPISREGLVRRATVGMDALFAVRWVAPVLGEGEADVGRCVWLSLTGEGGVAAGEESFEDPVGWEPFGDLDALRLAVDGGGVAGSPVVVVDCAVVGRELAGGGGEAEGVVAGAVHGLAGRVLGFCGVGWSMRVFLGRGWCC